MVVFTLGRKVGVLLMTAALIALWGPLASTVEPGKKSGAVLPSFRALAELSSRTRQAVLSRIILVAVDPTLDSLDSLLLTRSVRGYYICFPGLFGHGVTIQNPDKARRRFCKPRLESASAFFIDPRNAHRWEVLRYKVFMACRKTPDKCRGLELISESMKREWPYLQGRTP